MIGAACTTAIVAIAYAKVTEWVTSLMIIVSQSHQLMFLIAAPFWFILAWALVRFLDPRAAGSGIPQVLIAVETASSAEILAIPNRTKIWLSLRLIIVKILSSLAAILGGGAVGREGPTIQISAAIFEMFEGVFKKYVSGRKSREALIIAGGGAGLAAAFNTPLGGVVFAIEELASQHFKTFKGDLILTVVTAGYVTQAILGPYLFIGHPAIGTVTVRDTMIGLGASVGIGMIGAYFGKKLFTVTAAAKKLGMRGRILLAGGVGLAMSGACVMLGSDASGGGSLLIRKLLFGSATEVAQVGWLLAIWRVAGVLLTYVSGCAGGIFAPSLAAGAALGAMAAHLFSFDNHSLIIVLGMIGFLTGVTRSPFTSFILVFEMTDRQGAVIPMMAAALLANVFSRMIDHESFYEKTKEVLLNRANNDVVKTSSTDHP